MTRSAGTGPPRPVRGRGCARRSSRARRDRRRRLRACAPAPGARGGSGRARRGRPRGPRASLASTRSASADRGWPVGELAPGVEDQLHLLGHLVERPGEPRELLGPSSRARTVKSPAATCAAESLRRRDPLADVAGEEQRGEQRRRAAATATASSLTSSHMWNITRTQEDDRERRRRRGVQVRRAGRAPSGGRGSRGEHQPRHQGQDGEPEAGSDHGTSL